MHVRVSLFLVVLLFLHFLPGVLAETFNLPLDAGWNLVSVPIEPGDPDPDAVFQDIEALIVWEYDAEAGIYEIAERIEAGRGYWVYIEPDAAGGGGIPESVDVVGTAVEEASVSLDPGWHLVGPLGRAPFVALPTPLKVEGDAAGGQVIGWNHGAYRLVGELAPGQGGWMFCHGDSEVCLSPHPDFEGLVMGYSPDAGVMQLHWPEAADDRTPPEAMTYYVYAAPVGRGELIDDSHLVAAVVGTTFAVVDGLEPGETYQATVEAVDGDGSRSLPNPVVLTIPVLAAPLVLASQPRQLAGLGVTVLAVDAAGALLTVDTAGPLAAGDVIVFDNPNGTGLRRIVGMRNLRDGTVELDTEAANLAEVVGSGTLRCRLMVVETDSRWESRSRTGGQPDYLDPAGFFVLGGRLPGEDEAGDQRGDMSGSGDGDSVSFGTGVNLRFNLGFEPAFDVDARFGPGGWIIPQPQYVRMVARGRMSVDAVLELDNTINYSQSVWSKNLGGFGHTFRYVVGGVPVVQEVFVTFRGELELSAEAATSATIQAQAAKQLAFGFEWDSAGGYRLIDDSGFERNITVEVDAGIQASARLKVYPKFATRFYKCLETSFHVVPSFGLDAEMRYAPPPVEMTKFDVGFRVDSHVEASLKIFGLGDSWTSETRNWLDVKVFSLPELRFVDPPAIVEAFASSTFNVAVTDGVANPVPAGNIAWWIEAADRAGALPGVYPSADRRSASVAASELGTYRLWASGFGDSFLGELGRRYVSTTFTATDEDVFIHIPAGASAGTNPPEGEQPYTTNYPAAYSLSVAPFYMAKHELTLARWNHVRNWAVGHGYQDLPAGLGKGAAYPVNSVDWYQAVKWCNARSEMEGRIPCYTWKGAVYRTNQPDPQLGDPEVMCNFAGTGYRLPTSAEWEYAARGGRASSRFPWGDTITHDWANYWSIPPSTGGGPLPSYNLETDEGSDPRFWDDTNQFTSPVGSYPANGFGLNDVTGNVQEWCWDRDPDYTDIDLRIQRGGGWIHWGNHCRLGFRAGMYPFSKDDFVGFRLAFTVLP